MAQDILDEKLVSIEKALGGEEEVPTSPDKLGWHLDKIESLIEGGSGGGSTWGSITGTLSDQEDLQEALNAKQDTLVSGESIKTVNGESLLGVGNISITTYQAFDSSWPVDNKHTAKQFCDVLDADNNVTIGMGYFGGAKWSDKPSGLSNGDVVVEITEGPNHTKSIHLIMTSSSIFPYRWEYTYWSHGSVSGWRGVTPCPTDKPSQEGQYILVATVDSEGHITTAWEQRQ